MADEQRLAGSRSRPQWKAWLGAAVLFVGLAICGLYLYRLLTARTIVLRFESHIVLAILATYATASTCAAMFWRDLVLVATGKKLTLVEVVIGQAALMLGKYIPGKVAGIAGRVASVAAKISVPQAMALAMIEQIFLLSGLAITGLVAYALLTRSPISLVGVGVVVVATLCAPSTAVRLMSRQKLLGQKLIGPKLESALNALSLLGLPVSARGLVWSTAATLGVAGTAWFAPDLLMLGIGTAGRAGLVMCYALAILAGMLVFVMPGGIGAREAVFVALASPWLNSVDAISVAAVLRLINVSFDLLVGMIAGLLVRRI